MVLPMALILIISFSDFKFTNCTIVKSVSNDDNLVRLLANVRDNFPDQLPSDVYLHNNNDIQNGTEAISVEEVGWSGAVTRCRAKTSSLFRQMIIGIAFDCSELRKNDAKNQNANICWTNEQNEEIPRRFTNRIIVAKKTSIECHAFVDVSWHQIVEIMQTGFNVSPKLEHLDLAFNQIGKLDNM